MTRAHRNNDQYMMRFPDGMRDQVAAIAKANGRSMNTEILIALETMLAGKGIAPAPQQKPYNARLDTFVAAALSGLLARGSDSMDLAEAGRIGEKMLELMEKTEMESEG